MRRTIPAVAAVALADHQWVSAQSPTRVAAVPSQKGGQDIFGAYDVVVGWPKKLSTIPGHEGWTFGAGHRFPAVEAGNRRLVEAGGQHIRGFRRGLDYAFVPTLPGSAWTRSVLSGCHGQLDPSARPGNSRRRIYESLQGRPEVGPLPTPRRCHAAPGEGRRQVSSM